MSELNDEPSLVVRLPLLSVVMSFRNEENVLPEFIRRTRATLQALVDAQRISEYELIFVDDCSNDARLGGLS